MSFNTKENYYLFIPLQFKAKRNRIQPYPKCTEKDTKLNRKDKKNRIESMPLSITTLYDPVLLQTTIFSKGPIVSKRSIIISKTHSQNLLT